MKKKIKELQNKLALGIRRFSQFIYITFNKYADNYLWESASACSFGFIFSFIPVILIIIAILISVLQFSPTVLNFILNFCERIEPYYDFKPIVESLLSIKSVTFIHIFLGIWVIWMARKLFLSVVQGIQQIFRSKSQKNDIFYQIFTFVSEFLVVFAFITIIIFSFIFDKLLDLPFFISLRNTFPHIFGESGHNANRLVTLITYLMFFLFTFYCYRFVSGTKPKVRVCLFYATGSTFAIFIVSFFLSKFMNLSNYNIIYGTVSTVIVLLFKIYMFFIIFFFCGEMVYVSQFFDNLLIAQIYILPEMQLTKFGKKFCSFLFASPRLVYTETEIKTVPAGTIFYENHQSPEFVFYICNGLVKEYKDDIVLKHVKGDFFGDLPPILHKNYKTTAIAQTDCEIMLIEVSTFMEIIKQDYKASTEAVKKLNKFTGENNIL